MYLSSIDVHNDTAGFISYQTFGSPIDIPIQILQSKLF